MTSNDTMNVATVRRDKVAGMRFDGKYTRDFGSATTERRVKYTETFTFSMYR